MLDSVSYDDKSAIESRVIKRYSNRKLYDTKSSRYVTLPQIAEMVRAGEDVQIIDNRTKEDKTEVTLALIISEELKNSPGGIPLTTLRALIRNDSNPPPGLTSSLPPPSVFSSGAFPSAGLGPADAYGALHVGEIAARSGVVGGLFDSALGGPLAVLDGSVLESQEQMVDNPGKGLVDDARSRFEQWQAAMERRVRDLPDPQALEALQTQVQRLNERLAELERRLSNQAE